MGEALKRDFSRKYDPTGSPGTVRYALFNWLLVLFGVFAFLMFGVTLAAASKGVVVALVLMSVLSLPSLVEGRSWARALEGARLLSIPLGLAFIAVVR